MHLAAMVDIMQEDVGKDVADLFRDHAVLAAVGDNAAVEIVRRKLLAKGDQAPVGRDLGGKQRLRFIERHVIVKGGSANAALFQEIEIEVIDRKNVVERRLDRREEAGAFGFEFAGPELQHGAVEPVVRPEIVAGHAAQMLEQSHEFSRVTSSFV